MLTRHHVPVDDLEAIAVGRVGEPTGARVAAAERSRRMLMLRALAAAEADRGTDEGEGPLPPLAHAFELLVRAEALDPRAVASVLGHPPVGVWAVRLLGRLRAGAGPRSGEPPCGGRRATRTHSPRRPPCGQDFPRASAYPRGRAR